MERSDFRRTIDPPGDECEADAAVEIHAALTYTIPSVGERGSNTSYAQSAIRPGIRENDLPAVNVAGQDKIDTCL